MISVSTQVKTPLCPLEKAIVSFGTAAHTGNRSCDDGFACGGMACAAQHFSEQDLEPKYATSTYIKGARNTCCSCV